MLVLKRFGHQVHLMVQKEAKRCGIEFMGGLKDKSCVF